MLKEKIGDIKRGKFWMVLMENRIVEKQKYYNGVIEKLKNMGLQTETEQKHVSDAIKWNKLNKELELEF